MRCLSSVSHVWLVDARHLATKLEAEQPWVLRTFAQQLEQKVHSFLDQLRAAAAVPGADGASQQRWVGGMLPLPPPPLVSPQRQHAGETLESWEGLCEGVRQVAARLQTAAEEQAREEARLVEEHARRRHPFLEHLVTVVPHSGSTEDVSKGSGEASSKAGKDGEEQKGWGPCGGWLRRRRRQAARPTSPGRAGRADAAGSCSDSEGESADSDLRTRSLAATQLHLAAAQVDVFGTCHDA